MDFGRTASEYATYRTGFPDAFFTLLRDRGYAKPGLSALDIGTGTGTIARGLAKLGLHVSALDPSDALMKEARRLDKAAGVTVAYQTAKAEDTTLPGNSFDLITAGQCWHWFDRPRAAAEAARLLHPGGRLLIAHFDWIPMPGSVVEATEALILCHNPRWTGADGTGLYPAWLADLEGAGLLQIETASFDVAQPYSHAGWRGRIQASAGIKGSLDEPAARQFDEELHQLLVSRFLREPMLLPHRVWFATGVLPLQH